MEKCYQYFSCTKSDCSVYGKEDFNCWEENDTLCHYPGIGVIQDMLSAEGREKCGLCIYYKSVKKVAN